MDITLISKQREYFYAERNSLHFKLSPLDNWNTPEWAKGTPYQSIYRDAPKLLESGTLALARILQVNRDIFHPGQHDLPAQVVVALDDESNDLSVLDGYAEYILELMRTTSPLPTPVRDLNEMIKSVRQPPFLRKFVSIKTDDRKACWTTMLIHRKFLPDGMLEANWLPLLIDPARTDESILLPSHYWIPEIRDAWKNYKDWASQ